METSRKLACNPDILKNNEYPDIATIELEQDEAVGTLARLANKADGSLIIRGFRLGSNATKPRLIVLNSAAEGDVIAIFADVNSRIGKPILVRTDEGQTYGGVWVATEVISPDELG